MIISESSVFKYLFKYLIADIVRSLKVDFINPDY